MLIHLLFLQVISSVALARSSPRDHPTTVIQDTRTEVSVEEYRYPPAREYYPPVRRENEADQGLDFDYDEAEDLRPPGKKYPPLSKEHLMKEAMLKAMKKPAIREQIGEVIPILRAMSPTQRLTLAALVSTQIMSQGRLDEADLTEMAAMFAGNNVENLDDRQNITEHLLLPISVDIAKIFRGLGKDIGRSLRPDEPKFRSYRKQYRRKPYRTDPNRRMDVFLEDDIDDIDDGPQSVRRNTSEIQKLINEGVLQPSINDCEYFSSSFCLEVTDYPLDAIIKSVEKHQGIMDTLLEDFRIQSPEANGESPPPERQRMRRRQDTGPNDIRDIPPEKEFMCPSTVKYARPKRARTTTGQWKYIVNAGDYTQTLRLEMCLKPMTPCSYVTNNFNSQCTQVYNYHRLLTWEENKGLHMDMFKVPSCCSCHIQGYTSFYPPAKDFTYAEKRREPISLRPSYEPVDIPVFPNPSGKREAVRPIPLLPTVPPPQTQHSAFSNKEVVELAPLHHLVPPGPPLPLEGESIKFRNDLNFLKKRGAGDHRRVAEIIPHKTDTSKGHDEAIKQAGTRSKYANVILGNSRVASSTTSATRDSTAPALFFTPSRQHPSKSVEELRAQATADRIVQSSPAELFEIYEPGKLRTVTTTTTTTTPATTTTTTTAKYTENGRRKVNYNYHPIIEFFIPDGGERFSKPRYSSALESHDWTPLIARRVP